MAENIFLGGHCKEVFMFVLISYVDLLLRMSLSQPLVAAVERFRCTLVSSVDLLHICPTLA